MFLISNTTRSSFYVSHSRYLSFNLLSTALPRRHICAFFPTIGKALSSFWQRPRSCISNRSFSVFTKSIGPWRGGWVRTGMHGRCRMAIGPRNTTMAGRSKSGFHRPGRGAPSTKRRGVFGGGVSGVLCSTINSATGNIDTFHTNVGQHELLLPSEMFMFATWQCSVSYDLVLITVFTIPTNSDKMVNNPRFNSTLHSRERKHPRR